ncbi:hypothetical protein DD238_003766 [Peronospora effusa]|uniref:Uncharacterized protein n=1 Tax=Peronospora effusa TaxID=542832 RepID=A0A3M6VUE9_9STRA|nr:hypothetical protein DD238_003766 [Peronospora effusa]RQM10133.1 hypothetical protein DD237_005297 [Peronospora effusa]
MDFAAHFMKLNSPLGSSLLNSSLKKRKRSFLRDDGSYSDADEMKEDNDDDPRESMATPPRRQSLLGNARPAKRTFADDSSDSGVESDAFSLSTATRPNEPICAASSLPS